MMRRAQEDNQAEIGQKLAQKCRQNITDRRINKTKATSIFLESLALNSTSMISANRTTKLVEPKWDEDEKNYMI
jgi:hypothetical protein